MIEAKSPVSRIPGVIRNLNATSLKLDQFVVPVERPWIGEGEQAAEDAADKAEQHRLDEKAQQDAPRPETEREHGSDLLGARADRGVHRVHRAEDRAHRHDGDKEEPESPDDVGQHFRLGAVVVVLVARVDVQAGVGLDPA